MLTRPEGCTYSVHPSRKAPWPRTFRMPNSAQCGWPERAEPQDSGAMHQIGPASTILKNMSKSAPQCRDATTCRFRSVRPASSGGAVTLMVIMVTRGSATSRSSAKRGRLQRLSNNCSAAGTHTDGLLAIGRVGCHGSTVLYIRKYSRSLHSGTMRSDTSRFVSSGFIEALSLAESTEPDLCRAQRGQGKQRTWPIWSRLRDL